MIFLTVLCCCGQSFTENDLTTDEATDQCPAGSWNALIPLMLSDSVPSGIIGISGMAYGDPTYAGFKAFDQDTTTTWWNGGGVGWITYDFQTTSVLVKQWKITSPDGFSPYQYDIQFYGGANTNSMTMLDEISGTFNAQTTITRTIVNNTRYQVYKWIFVSPTVHSAAAEFQLYGCN